MCHPLSVPYFSQISLPVEGQVSKYMSLRKDIWHSNHNGDIGRHISDVVKLVRCEVQCNVSRSLRTLLFKGVKVVLLDPVPLGCQERMRLAAPIVLASCSACTSCSSIHTHMMPLPCCDAVGSGSGPSLESAPCSLHYQSADIQPKASCYCKGKRTSISGEWVSLYSRQLWVLTSVWRQSLKSLHKIQI